jgi:transcriptional regulator GlxA family with amidase domain
LRRGRRQICDCRAALDVARQLVVFLKRPGGQSQFSAELRLQASDDRFEPLHAWIASHPKADLSVGELARRAGMGERSFARHYRQAIGQTPARAVERIRVEAARRRLCDSRNPVKTIARACGFGSEDAMRRGFLRVLRVLPQECRARFAVETRTTSR